MKVLEDFIKPFEAPQRSYLLINLIELFLFVRDWDGKG